MGAPDSPLDEQAQWTRSARSIIKLLLRRETEPSPLPPPSRNGFSRTNSRIGVSVTNRFDYFVEGRAFEWVMAISMLVGGIEIVGWPDYVSFGLTPWLLTILPQHYLGWAMTAIGWIRVSGLMLNGQTIADVEVGPWARAICAVLSGSLWVQFAFSLVVISYQLGMVSVGIPFWIMFTLGELYIAYTVMKHAR